MKYYDYYTLRRNCNGKNGTWPLKSYEIHYSKMCDQTLRYLVSHVIRVGEFCVSMLSHGTSSPPSDTSFTLLPRDGSSNEKSSGENPSKRYSRLILWEPLQIFLVFLTNLLQSWKLHTKYGFWRASVWYDRHDAPELSCFSSVNLLARRRFLF